MPRTRLRSLLGPLVVGSILLGLAACSSDKEAPSVLNEKSSPWLTRDSAVNDLMRAVQGKQETMELGFYSLPVADPTDTTVLARREEIRGALDKQASELGDVQTRLNSLAEQRASLAAGGSSSAFDDAWSDAQQAYNEIESKLHEVEGRYQEIATLIGKESMPGVTDSTGADG